MERTNCSNNFYINDIKTFLVPHSTHHYLYDHNNLNTQSKNTIYYNKNLVNKILRKLPIEYKPYLNLNNQHNLDFAIIEKLLFNIDIEKDIVFKVKKNNSTINNRTILNKRFTPIKTNKLHIYFSIDTEENNIMGNKINDKFVVLQITEEISNQKITNIPPISNFNILHLLNQNNQIALIEKDYFLFKPMMNIKKLDKDFTNYFNIFECSYFYYNHSVSMDIILNYYLKLDEILDRYHRQTMPTNHINQQLISLNTNTKALLIKNKLL